jgi:hypothetical protein
MFSMLKWMVLLSFIGATWYLASLILNLNDHDMRQVKEDAKVIIDKGDPSALTNTISDKVKQDISQKKHSLVDAIRRKINGTISDPGAE